MENPQARIVYDDIAKVPENFGMSQYLKQFETKLIGLYKIQKEEIMKSLKAAEDDG